MTVGKLPRQSWWTGLTESVAFPATLLHRPVLPLGIDRILRLGQKQYSGNHSLVLEHGGRLGERSPRPEELGWEYRAAHVWDKGIAHIAGNANTKSLRKLPVVTELCVQYVRKAEFPGPSGKMSMKEWLRYEWERSGLPLYLTNEACGVRNAATRKYFTKDHLFYFPPAEAFEALARYANERGNPHGYPYFSLDGQRPISKEEWGRMRAKFQCPIGVTNVWSEPAVRGQERLKTQYKCVHTNQKPLRLLERVIEVSTEPNDLVWEPFGGLCTTAIAALRTKRRCVSAEILPDFFDAAVERLEYASAP